MRQSINLHNNNKQFLLTLSIYASTCSILFVDAKRFWHVRVLNLVYESFYIQLTIENKTKLTCFFFFLHQHTKINDKSVLGSDQKSQTEKWAILQLTCKWTCLQFYSWQVKQTNFLSCHKTTSQSRHTVNAQFLGYYYRMVERVKLK